MHVTIENTITTYDYDTLLSFAQLIQASVNSKNEDELRDIIKSMPYISLAQYYFEWGFGKHHFWVKQRKAPHSKELKENRILIVTFE